MSMLKTYRLQRNIKMTEAAKMLNISYTYLWQLENQNNIPSNRLKFNIIKYYKLNRFEIKTLWPEFYKKYYKPSFLNKLKNFFLAKLF